MGMGTTWAAASTAGWLAGSTRAARLRAGARVWTGTWTRTWTGSRDGPLWPSANGTRRTGRWRGDDGWTGTPDGARADGRASRDGAGPVRSVRRTGKPGGRWN